CGSRSRVHDASRRARSATPTVTVWMARALVRPVMPLQSCDRIGAEPRVGLRVHRGPADRSPGRALVYTRTWTRVSAATAANNTPRYTMEYRNSATAAAGPWRRRSRLADARNRQPI